MKSVTLGIHLPAFLSKSLYPNRRYSCISVFVNSKYESKINIYYDVKNLQSSYYAFQVEDMIHQLIKKKQYFLHSIHNR